MKENPELQMKSHHDCRQMNQDFAQCVLFDGNTDKSNMHCVEYIISEKLFEKPGHGKNCPISTGVVAVAFGH